MEKENFKNEEMLSLNSELTEFHLLELEQRLETDPIAVGGLLNMASSGEMSFTTFSSEECNKHCSGASECNVH